MIFLQVSYFSNDLQIQNNDTFNFYFTANVNDHFNILFVDSFSKKPGGL